MSTQVTLFPVSEKQVPVTSPTYPVPGHLQKMFGEQKNTNWNLPITDKLTPCVCSLPVHTEMDEVQLAYIVEGVKSFFK